MSEMSLTTAIWLYYLLSFSGTAVLATLFYRKRSWLSFLGGGVLLGLYTLVLALVLAMAPFNPLRAARLLCHGWFVQVPIYLILTSVRPQIRHLRSFATCMLVVIAAIVWFSFCVEPFRLEVKYYQVPSRRISSPLRIGIMSDYQTDKLQAYEKNAWRRLLAEQPDVIFMPGDFLQADTREGWETLRDETNSFLREVKFSAPLGIFAVGGNADFRRRWPEVFDGLDVHSMRDTETLETDRFVLTGLAVEDSFDANLRLPRTTDKLHLALGHAPDFALSRSVDADLLIAGHTHGGQVCLPVLGPLVTFSQVPSSWAAGLTQLDPKRTLIVSRGVGMERRDAPRLRFLCRPQLVIVDVVPMDERPMSSVQLSSDQPETTKTSRTSRTLNRHRLHGPSTSLVRARREPWRPTAE